MGWVKKYKIKVIVNDKSDAFRHEFCEKTVVEFICKIPADDILSVQYDSSGRQMIVVYKE